MAIQDLTSSEIRERSARYSVPVTGTVGTTFLRLIVFLIALFLLFPLISMVVAGFVTSLIGINYAPYFQLAAAAVWVFIALTTIEYFVVNVPKYTGALLTNYFGGIIHVLGAGLHIKFPWEYYSQDDFIDLRAISIEHTSRFVVKGGTIKKPKGAVGTSFKWTVQYGPFLPLLPLYVRTEEKAITDGFEEVVENAISEDILGKSLPEMLDKKTVDDLQEALKHAFVGEDVNGHIIRGSRDTFDSSLEERFGLKVELSTLGPPEFDKDYTEALTASVLNDIITKDAKTMAEKLNIAEEKALRMIMILQKEAISEQVFTLQADEQIQALAPVLMSALRDAGDAGRGMQAATGRGGGRKTKGSGN